MKTLLAKLMHHRALLAFSAVVCLTVITSVVKNSLLQKPHHMKALGLLPINTLYTDSVVLKPDDVGKLLVQFDYQPLFASEGATGAPEPVQPGGFAKPNDAKDLGIGTAKMLIDSRWATVRYVGKNPPAGAGLTGAEFEKAQRDAFGTATDSTPVFTAAWTINEMMDKYFVPLLESIGTLSGIASDVKVQASYFSPDLPYQNNVEVGRDNAYVVNLQSMYIYPSSCFDNPKIANCKTPYTSTGHDPTVIGHELGHVIFNHVRGKRSLDGFQWFAVNEGYADYFSAAFFAEPVLGRVWRYNRSESPYLRRLIDVPSLASDTLGEDAHKFSMIFSSALWHAREKIVAANASDAQDADRVVLQSIAFLGETQKPRLGDAATAVLKAAEVLGFAYWKDIYREEFKKAEISLAVVKPIEFKIDRAAEQPKGQQAADECGVVVSLQHGTLMAWQAFVLMMVLPVTAVFLLQATRRPK